MENESQTKINKPTSFYQAVRRASTGVKVRRLEWQNENIYVAMIDEILRIYDAKDEKMHPWTINLGDIEGMDWVVKK